MNKYEALCESLAIVCPEYDSIIKKYSDNALKYGKGSLKAPFDGNTFLTLISRPEYSMKELGISPSSISRLLKELLPGRVTTTTGSKPCSYILECVGHKYCANCDTVKELSEFRLNKAKRSGYNVYCKVCHLDTTAKTQAARQSQYRAAKLKRIVPWSELDEIKEFIIKCPSGYAVDHVIPLQGELVSGLHVLSNLQYLPSVENSQKSNKYEIE